MGETSAGESHKYKDVGEAVQELMEWQMKAQRLEEENMELRNSISDIIKAKEKYRNICIEFHARLDKWEKAERVYLVCGAMITHKDDKMATVWARVPEGENEYVV